MVTPFQEALNRRDFAEAQRLRELRTPFAGSANLLDISQDPSFGLLEMTGAADVFQPYLIYPKMTGAELGQSGKGESVRLPGRDSDAYFVWTGEWKLSSQAQERLEQQMARSLGETGMQVLPMKVLESGTALTEWRDNWGPPAQQMGIGNTQQSPNIKPVYIVRGLGAYAGADATPNFENSYMVVGDGVIEALAGYKGPTAYERVLTEFEGKNPDEARYMASQQSQMGTVLHEALHEIAQLPHTGDEAMVQNYATNYGGAHGDEFRRMIDRSIVGTRPDDRLAAMRLVMQEPWNYGWGSGGAPGVAPTQPGETPAPAQELVQKAQAGPVQGPAPGGGIARAIPAVFRGPPAAATKLGDLPVGELTKLGDMPVGDGLQRLAGTPPRDEGFSRFATSQEGTRMPITQQQFDFMAAVMGPERAAQEARDAGGVTPSQGTVAPTQITGAQFDGDRLTGGRYTPGAAGLPIARADVPQNVFANFVDSSGPMSGEEMRAAAAAAGGGTTAPAAGLPLTDQDKIVVAERQFRAALGAGQYAGMTSAQAISAYSALLQQQGISVGAADGRARDQVPGWLSESGQTGVDWPPRTTTTIPDGTRAQDAGGRWGTYQNGVFVLDTQPTGATDVQSKPPTGAELTAILQGIANDWQNGVFAGDTTSLVQAIADKTGVDYSVALSDYWGLIQPDITGSGLAPGAAPVTGAPVTGAPVTAAPVTGAPGPVPTPGAVSPVGDPRARESFFQAQEPSEVFGRVLEQQYGPLTPTARQALTGQWGRFQDIDPITRGGLPQTATGEMPELGNRFAAFLAGARPTRAGLNQQLTDLMAANLPGTEGERRFQEFFPDAPGAAAAAVQPFVQSLAPRMRATATQNLAREFGRQYLTAPEAYKSPAQIANIFEEYRQRGFIQ